MHIHFGQSVCGLLTLRVGGCLVVKHYTLNQPFTISLVVTLSCLFQELYIVKPETSRPTNSETYLVGKGFKGLAAEDRRILLSRLTDFGQVGRPEDEPPLVDLGAPGVQASIGIVWRAVRQIHLGQQVAFLDEAVQFYAEFGEKPGRLRAGLGQVARNVQDNWLQHSPVYRLASADQIPQHVGSGPRDGKDKRCGKPAAHR